MYKSFEELIKATKTMQLPIWKVILEEDCKENGITKEDSFAKMAGMYLAMRESNEEYEAELKSASGLVGGEAEKIRKAAADGKLSAGSFLTKVMEKALRVSASNACMKRIVAAPTAGSCGVLPAVLLSIQDDLHVSDEKMVEALYVAAGIGGIIAYGASLSGAEGGCQAEIGSASAMAAGALTYLKGGNVTQVCHASAIALKGLLGLVCDPVAGLVEVPCVKRNVIGAVNAVTSSDMAIAGIKSRIPPDEVVAAMRQVGNAMNTDLKETGKGGLAATPTGTKIAKKMKV